MKKLLLVIILLVACACVFVPKSFASVLYSNDFTSSFTGFNVSDGLLTTSANGLISSGNDSVATYTITNFQNLGCISALITTPLSSEADLYFNATQYTPGTSFVELVINPDSQNNRDIQISNGGTEVLDTGVLPDTSPHTYEFCKNSDIYSVFMDGTQIGSVTIANPFSLTYFGLEENPSNSSPTITNFVVEDAGSTPTPTPTPTPDNQPLTVNSISNATLNEGSTYSSASSFTDPNSSASSWTATVNYGDGSGTNPLTLYGQNFSLSHVYSTPGTYLVTVSVTDNLGITGVGIATITVNDVAPVVTFSFSPNGSNGWFISSPATGNVAATTLSLGSTTISSLTCTGGTVSNLLGLGTNNVSGTLSVSTQGTTTVSCTSRDNLNTQTTQQIIVNLDTTNPTCTVIATPSQIWPPNKKLVDVSEAVSPTDTISGFPVSPFILQSITNTDTLDSSDYLGFAVGTPATSGQLRTIRNGAVYTLTYQVTDIAGLTNTCQDTVSVSH
jgi:hypothetical protein